MLENYIQQIELLLQKANFETLTFESKQKYCFDLLVKRADSILLIKVFTNIDNLNEYIINGIKTLSSLLKSKPILIGIKNRYQNLEDDTIYIREDLPFINLKTFEKIISVQNFPYILARRGGAVVFLDGHQMKTMREKQTISRKILSEKLNVTKRTICSYENENMRPSQKIAQKIVEILQDKDNSIFRKINVFEWTVKFSLDQEEIFGEELNPFDSHLKEVFEDIGISSHWYKKGQVPFKLSLYSKSLSESSEMGFYPLFSAVSDEKNKLKDLHVKTLMMFSKLFQKHGICIVNNDFKIPSSLSRSDNLPIIKLKRLEKIDDEEGFIELIREKE